MGGSKGQKVHIQEFESIEISWDAVDDGLSHLQHWSRRFSEQTWKLVTKPQIACSQLLLHEKHGFYLSLAFWISHEWLLLAESNWNPVDKGLWDSPVIQERV